MQDYQYKKQLIQSIHQLQLSDHLICALDDAEQAEQVISVLQSLQQHAQHWQ